MTAQELRAYINNLSNINGIEKSLPKTLEVDAETYANACQAVFENMIENELYVEVNSTCDGELKEYWINYVVVGKNRGIMFKNIELILKK